MRLPHLSYLFSLQQWLPKFVAPKRMFTKYFFSMSLGSSYSIYTKPNSSYSPIYFCSFTYSSQKQGIPLKSSFSFACHFQLITDSQAISWVSLDWSSSCFPFSLPHCSSQEPNIISSRIYSTGIKQIWGWSNILYFYLPKYMQEY